MFNSSPMTFLLVLGLSKHVGSASFFVQTSDCNRRVGCALDDPSEVLNGIQSKLRCALECDRNDFCINFNYWQNKNLCQLLEVYPFKIQAIAFCISYDLLFPRLNLVAQDDANVAKFKRTCQSKTFAQNWSWYAVDNATKSNISACSQVDGNKQENWFMVDLREYFTLKYIRILTRQGGQWLAIRYKDLAVGVTNSSWLEKVPVKNTYPLCGVYAGTPNASSWFQIDCDPKIPPARFVIAHQAQVDSVYGGFLSLCEFQAFK